MTVKNSSEKYNKFHKIIQGISIQDRINIIKELNELNLLKQISPLKNISELNDDDASHYIIEIIEDLCVRDRLLSIFESKFPELKKDFIDFLSKFFNNELKNKESDNYLYDQSYSTVNKQINANTYLDYRVFDKTHDDNLVEIDCSFEDVIDVSDSYDIFYKNLKEGVENNSLTVVHNIGSVSSLCEKIACEIKLNSDMNAFSSWDGGNEIDSIYMVKKFNNDKPSIYVFYSGGSYIPNNYNLKKSITAIKNKKHKVIFITNQTQDTWRKDLNWIDTSFIYKELKQEDLKEWYKNNGELHSISKNQAVAIGYSLLRNIEDEIKFHLFDKIVIDTWGERTSSAIPATS
ncbi:hypothetical protein [Candidatus Venteria ishoeyi]|uniref:Uncharacterized protein n=1 Tax=Candidatus Venteria ishoeyi TaxID=1899563 RepID=A0A1H6F6W1_9GAMM|nr:hypothetical protein [Candidatus Venteria ishoeyi]SEH05029.1 Uncharacterised protein [Candidatus Venteria ishoeyi]